MKSRNAHPAPKLIGRGGRPRPLAGAVVILGQHIAEAAAMACQSMREDGAASVVWLGAADEVAAAIEAGGVTLAHIDVDLPGGDVIDVARRVRFDDLGENPFLPIMITAAHPRASVVSAALWAGVDDIVVGAQAAAPATQRILRIAFARKPFVATREYVGPKHPRLASELAGAYEFEPPNILQAAILGRSLTDFAEDPAFKRARARVTVTRLDRATFDVGNAAREALTIRSDNPNARLAASRALRLKADRLLRQAAFVPAGRLRGAVDHLSSVARVAAGDAATLLLAARLSEGISDILSQRGENAFEFPSDFKVSLDDDSITFFD